MTQHEPSATESSSSRITLPPKARVPSDAVQMTAQMDWHGPTNFYVARGVHPEDRRVAIDGIFVATDVHHDVGTPVTLEMRLPDGARAWVQGRVEWVQTAHDGRRAGLGIRFAWLSTITAAELTVLARLRAPLVYDGNAPGLPQ